MSTQNVRVTILACALALFSAMTARPGCAADGAGAALPAGALRNSSSLYLREASSGPIRWQPWDEASFGLARKLNRPMLIDIGAIWCHWCHVMDQTTYSDSKVAALVNASFVPVKVDTDERPDIDGFYQAAAQNFGAGGWPLTCFTTPDGAPLYIAGYMPPQPAESDARGHGMIWVLQRVKDGYAKDPKFASLAHQIAAKVGKGESGAGPAGGSSDQLRTGILNSAKASFDEQARDSSERGPRFYDFPATRLMLAHGFFGHPEFTASAVTRLRTIAAGGVYDQLGGGFHRYSIDSRWRVPHFEKMAYDQAMALRTYAEAYEATHDEAFARIAKSIIKYVGGTLLDRNSHAFYSHQDADSFAGDDGSYYTWTEAEVRRAAGGRDADAALMHFGFTEDPGRAPDRRIVLRDAMGPDQIAKRMRLAPQQVSAALARAADKMIALRMKRRAPLVDTAILTDRNALMASAYIAASAALADESLRRIALDDIDYLNAHSRAADGSFYHVLDRAQPSVPGLATDQVYLMGAMLDAYQVSGDRKYLDNATSLASLIFEKYRDSATGLLKNRVPATKGTVLTQVSPGAEVFYDDPTPAVQGFAAAAFQTLASLTSDRAYQAKAEQLLAPAPSRIGAFAGPNNGALGLALEEKAHGEAVIAVAGPDADPRTAQLFNAALATYRPGKVVIRPAADSSARIPDAMKAMFETARQRKVPLAFVCAGTACANPASSADALIQTIRDFGVDRAAGGNLAARSER